MSYIFLNYGNSRKSLKLFTDYFMERLDTRQDYGEDRWVALGMIHGVTVVLVYTVRDC